MVNARVSSTTEGESTSADPLVLKLPGSRTHGQVLRRSDQPALFNRELRSGELVCIPVKAGHVSIGTPRSLDGARQHLISKNIHMALSMLMW